MKILSLLSSILVLFCSSLNAQCILTFNDDTQAEILNCISACTCSSVVIPDAVTVNMAGDLDLTSAGDIVMTIQGSGSLVFDGNGINAEQLLLTENSFLVIDDSNNPNALVENGSNGSIRIYIGTDFYNGNQFDQIIMGGGVGPGGILPVVWGNLSYKLLDSEELLVEWETLFEQGNAFFDLEMYEKDLDKYRQLARIDSEGDSDSPKQYTYVYSGPLHENLTFRIKQTDWDGKMSYSKVLQVKLPNLNTFRLKLDTFSKEIRISPDFNSKSFDYKLYGILGNVLSSGTVSSSELILDLNSFSSYSFVLLESRRGRSIMRLPRQW